MNLASSHYHFIGIGGIGMCGLAELLFEMGAKVTGSDPADNAQVARLKDKGILVFSEHSADNIGDADVIVYSSAIPPGHIEIVTGREMKIPIIPRAEALAELMRLKRGIAVAGTHGKTTTTSLLSSVFIHADKDPTIVVGGRLADLKSTACLGQGEWLIAEADESDGSFSKLSPEIVVLTNIDNDHLDHYGSFENLEKAFADFALQVPFYGMVLACGDDENLQRVMSGFNKKVRFYGFSEGCEYQIHQSGSAFEASFLGEKLGEFRLNMPGRHNALNALGAISAFIEAHPGVSVRDAFSLAVKGIECFTGVDRRAQFKGEVSDIKVFDDYGHHPTEVRAVLSGFKDMFPESRLVVYFQPHRYSRTQLCWDDFLKSFTAADHVFVTDIYPAGEKEIIGVTGERMAVDLVHSSCEYITKSADVSQAIVAKLGAGDVFLTLGAGDGWKIGMEVLAELQKGTSEH